MLGMIATAPSTASAQAKWEAAVVTGASATADNTGFTITANVELPQPKGCYDVQISQLHVYIPPPHYLVEQRHNGKICIDVPTPYLTKQHFAAKPLPKSVNVYALDANHKAKHWVLPIIIEHK
jgi:hypothetical protein